MFFVTFLNGILKYFASHRVEPGVAGPTCTKLDATRLPLDPELSSRHVEMDRAISTVNLHRFPIEWEIFDEVVEATTTSPTNSEFDLPGLGLDAEASNDITE